MRGEPDSIVALAKWSILNRLHDWNDPLKDPSVGTAARGKKRGGTGGPRSLPSAFSLPLSHPAPKSLPGQATSLRLISSTLSLVALPFLSFFLSFACDLVISALSLFFSNLLLLEGSTPKLAN